MNDNIKNAEFKALEQQVKQTISELEFCDQQFAELRQAKKAIADIQTQQVGEIIWVQLAHGIKVRAKLDSTDEFLVHVGADTTVVKSADESIKLVQEQMDALSSFMDQLQKKLHTLSKKADTVNFGDD